MPVQAQSCRPVLLTSGDDDDDDDAILMQMILLTDGHHLWETEAKVDKDSTKSVSSA